MKISTVVPTKNSGRTLATCLESLADQTYPDTETIVVDNQSTDDTVAIAERLADVVIDQGPERCAQRNKGAEVATGDVVLFIDSDMVLEPTVLSEIAEVLTARPEVGAVTIPERSFGDGFLAECRALEKSLYVGDADVEAPRAFRREVFEKVGGWDETLTAAEDWELSDRTKAHNVVIDRVPSWIWHDEGRISLRAQFQKKKYYGRWVAVYFHRKPEARSHVSRPGVFRQRDKLLAHPTRSVGMVVLKSFEAAGLLAGMRDARKQGWLDADR
ncbi:MAG: glycosyltransferase [Candidatus Nanopelagicales bacterium]